MNDLITNNLFEFWSFVGQQNDVYSEYSNYKAVSVTGSDWPNRIYALDDQLYSFDEIIRLSNQYKLPNIITTHKHKNILTFNKIQKRFTQVNMSLDLMTYHAEISKNHNIYQIETKSDAFEFANIASESFGYKVDGRIVYPVSKDNSICKLFIFREKNESYGCGIIFFDNRNVAGLHMIGTIPSGRGKGIGKSMTEKLIDEALINNSKQCVLNASKMGESIYKNLGFTNFGLLENYTILT
jgi:GNAT superfamily N-acetyltransferase